MSHIVSSVLSFYNCWLEYSKRVQRVLLHPRILAAGSHTALPIPGDMIMNSPAGMSPSNVPVCKLIIYDLDLH